MSEYQYYEFRALDRPLTSREMASLRAISSRAGITPGSFCVTYNCADFRGDPETLMGKYFDTFVYVANWGTREFMLRLPEKLPAQSGHAPFCTGSSLRGGIRREHLVLSFCRSCYRPIKAGDRLSRSIPTDSETGAPMGSECSHDPFGELFCVCGCGLRTRPGRVSPDSADDPPGDGAPARGRREEREQRQRNPRGVERPGNAEASLRELYDFSQSEKERDSVAEKHPGVAQRLSRHVLAWRKSLPVLE